MAVRRDGSVVRKPFSWSFSKLKNYETCPKRHWELDLNPLKTYKENDDSGALGWGNYVHACMKDRCGASRTPLPPDLAAAVPCAELWAQKVLGNAKPEDILVEQDLAINREFGTAAYFGADAWLRVKADFIRMAGDVALSADWKTGKILEDSFQLALSAACIFAKYPQIRAVRCAFIWLKEDAESSENFLREDMPKMWRALWPRIAALEQAYLQQDYPPKPNRNCRAWCAVKACPHNGKTYP
jgi:hypothetical protein